MNGTFDWVGIVCSVVVCLCCAFVGGAIGNRYRARQRFAEQWEAFNREMLNNVRFIKTPLHDFIERHRGKTKGSFDRFLESYDRLCVEGRAEEKGIAALSDRADVDRKTCAQLTAYFTALGKCDEENQLRTLEYYQGVLGDYAAECGKLSRTNGKLAERLGFLIGLAVMIMLV